MWKVLFTTHRFSRTSTYVETELFIKYIWWGDRSTCTHWRCCRHTWLNFSVEAQKPRRLPAASLTCLSQWFHSLSQPRRWRSRSPEEFPSSQTQAPGDEKCETSAEVQKTEVNHHTVQIWRLRSQHVREQTVADLMLATIYWECR